MRRLAAATLLLLSGCAVSAPKPDTRLPLPPERSSAVIRPASGPAQQIEAGAPKLPQWWRAFGSEKLDALVTEALTHNQDIASSEATLRQSQELARVTAGGQGPQADASYQLQRVRISQALASPLADSTNDLYTLHTAQVTVSYPIDLFGGGRARVRSARAAARAAAGRLAAARATVIANLVNAVIQHASLGSQAAAAARVIQTNREILTLLERRRRLGDVGESDVTAQRAALATSESALPPLQRQLQHQAVLIGTILGKPAGSGLPLLPTMGDLRLPTILPLTVPANIVADRPDVRTAAAQMEGAAADLGASIAARLPSVQLSGNVGGSATSLLEMFATGNPFYSLLGGITQPLFHSGQLRHQERASEAALKAAEAQYRAAALQAFLDVDDAIAALRSDADALDAATRADAAARRSLEMVRRQVQLGAQGTLALLNASTVAAQAGAQRIQAEAARLSDTVGYFQATGAAPESSR